MITYIELPLRGTWTVNGHDILVVAFYYEHGLVGCVFVDEDGSMGQTALSDVNINWRYDNNRHKWVDVDTGEDLGDTDDGEQPN